VDEVVVRRAGRHRSTLSTAPVLAPEDAPNARRHDTPGEPEAAERDRGIASVPIEVAASECGARHPR
jgi:hypothetical protein